MLVGSYVGVWEVSNCYKHLSGNFTLAKCSRERSGLPIVSFQIPCGCITVSFHLHCTVCNVLSPCSYITELWEGSVFLLINTPDTPPPLSFVYCCFLLLLSPHNDIMKARCASLNRRSGGPPRTSLALS